MRRVIDRLSWLNEFGSGDDLPIGGRLLGVHALPGSAELPRPRQQ